MLFIAETNEDPGWFTQAIIDFLDWLLGWVKDLIQSVYDSVMANIPVEWSTKIESLMSGCSDVFSIVNYWVPLDWGMSIIGAYFVFIIFMIMIKLGVKLFIPTVG